MLVIRRRLGEALLIGPDVEIEVVELSATRVKLGIRAPREVLILRKELRQAAEHNLAAARGISPRLLETLLARLRGA